MELVKSNKLNKLLNRIINEGYSENLLLEAAKYCVRAAYSNNDHSGLKLLLYETHVSGHEDPFLHWLRLAGIDCTLINQIGKPDWTVNILNKKRQAKAFEFIETTPIDYKVTFVKQPERQGRARDDREKEEQPNTSVHTVPGGGVGVGRG